MNEEDKVLVKELVGKIHDAMESYTGPVRFDALSQVLAAGIVAYGNTPEEEAKVFGAIVYDLVRDIDALQEFRAEVKTKTEELLAEAAESTIN